MKQKIGQLGLSPEQIYNADEFGLYWRCLPEKTLVHADEKGPPGRKISKDRFTFMPCANATSRHKFRLLVIGKSKKRRPFKDILCIIETKKLLGLIKQSSKDGSKMNSCRANLEKKPLLVLDNAASHRLDETLASQNEPLSETDVEKWARGDEENLDIEGLTDDEIVVSITRQDQSSDEENEPVQNKSSKEAVMAFNLCLRWTEENKLPLHEVIFLRRIRQKAVYLSIRKGVQRTLDNFFLRNN
nr:unnamed protein product [Callosobruchus analis]